MQEFEVLAPKAVERLEAGFEDAMIIMALPEPVRRWKVHHLALLMEIDEAWATGLRYLDMAEYWAWRDKQEHAEA